MAVIPVRGARPGDNHKKWTPNKREAKKERTKGVDEKGAHPSPKIGGMKIQPRLELEKTMQQLAGVYFLVKKEPERFQEKDGRLAIG